MAGGLATKILPSPSPSASPTQPKAHTELYPTGADERGHLSVTQHNFVAPQEKTGIVCFLINDPHPPALLQFWQQGDPNTPLRCLQQAMYAFAAVSVPTAAGPYQTATPWLA